MPTFHDIFIYKLYAFMQDSFPWVLLLFLIFFEISEMHLII